MNGKVKYYFRKPKGEIAKDILGWLAIAGVVAIAATSPYFIRALLRTWIKGKQYKQRSIETAFQRLRKSGAITIEKKGNYYAVSLTQAGKKRAGLFQIDSLKISKPKNWDEKWRILMFDIKQAERWKRDVLRGFLKRLEFVQFQKSVWIHPYDCKVEVELLQELLGLTHHEMKLIIVEDIGRDGKELSQKFKL